MSDYTPTSPSYISPKRRRMLAADPEPRIHMNVSGTEESVCEAGYLLKASKVHAFLLQCVATGCPDTPADVSYVTHEWGTHIVFENAKAVVYDTPLPPNPNVNCGRYRGTVVIMTRNEHTLWKEHVASEAARAKAQAKARDQASAGTKEEEEECTSESTEQADNDAGAMLRKAWGAIYPARRRILSYCARAAHNLFLVEEQSKKVLRAHADGVAYRLLHPGAPAYDAAIHSSICVECGRDMLGAECGWCPFNTDETPCGPFHTDCVPEVCGATGKPHDDVENTTCMSGPQYSNSEELFGVDAEGWISCPDTAPALAKKWASHEKVKAQREAHLRVSVKYMRTMMWEMQIHFPCLAKPACAPSADVDPLAKALFLHMAGQNDCAFCVGMLDCEVAARLTSWVGVDVKSMPRELYMALDRDIYRSARVYKRLAKLV